jgi:hypothetical protein
VANTQPFSSGENASHNYERGGSRELDLKSVQFAMCTLGADACVETALLSFCLEEDTLESSETDFGTGLFESFFEVMVALVTEMPSLNPSYGRETDRMLVHFLASGPMAFSQLTECSIPYS